MSTVAPPPPPAKDNGTTDTIIGVVAVIIIAVVVAGSIICCQKNIRKASKAFMRLLMRPGKPVQTVSHAGNMVGDSRQPPFAVILDSEFEAATMEKFLNDIERDRPMRLSSGQLVGCTDNFATKLGSGAFGFVYKGVFPNGVQVAVKVLKGDWNKRIEEQFMAEVGAISRTYHINLVRLYGFCFDVRLRALVYEYMHNGSLDTFLFCRNPVIEWKKLHEIAIGTAKGIAYLHEECQERIIHYDIKPGNVLLDANFSPKVADFGLAKLCNRDKTHVTGTGFRGSPGYAAPELWMPFRVTHKCDVYSFGMMLFEIVGRRKNTNPVISGSQQWFPGWVWKMFEEGRLTEIMVICGIEEESRVKAKKMIMVALWCVQHAPELRPLMSTVVKFLEGEGEIAPPPNPFQHLHGSGEFRVMQSGTESNSYWTCAKTSHTSTQADNKHNMILAISSDHDGQV